MKIKQISLVVVAALLVGAGVGYHSLAEHAKVLAQAQPLPPLPTEAEAPPPAPAVSAAPVFPEAQLNALTPQIDLVATNITHLIDSGDAVQLGKVWDAAALLAQRSVSRDKFILTLEGLHQGLGTPAKRNYQSTVYKSVTQAADIPSGQYITVNYLTSYQNEAEPRKEALIFVFQQNEWKLVGYHISALKSA